MQTIRVFRTLCLVASSVFCLGVSTAPAAVDKAADPAQVPLYDNLGSHHFPISTRVPLAQKYFDQGIRLTYAFNHAEAIRAFAQAARLDPKCAMCYWGIAYAYGPNINAPMAADAVAPAWQALGQAQALASAATPREQAYIEALSQRYRADPPTDRAALDQAFAEAMGQVAERFPKDQDAATLHAEALMDLSPWDYWTEDRQPKPATRVILSELERVIAANPNHPGACHYYIHAVEAAYPERAEPCADRLAGLMPGAGHLVHMPAHIYIRVGRWQDAIEANRHAVHVDEEYIADQQPRGVYPIAYYPHNYHFLAFAASMAGRSEEAIEAARAVSQEVTAEVARKVPEVEPLVTIHQQVLATFGRWDEALAAPVPARDLPVAYGMAQYVRGVALAAKGQQREARAALANLERIAPTVATEPGKTMLQVARHALSGEINARAGRRNQAIADLRAAAAAEDSMPYMEPPYWLEPVRHALGAALLEDGRFAEAEAVYRQDLERFPRNGWSLHGLAQSLRGQDKNREAAELERQFQEAWSGADVRLASAE